MKLLRLPPLPLEAPRYRGILFLKLYSEISLSRIGFRVWKKIPLSDKKKVETAASAEVSEKVKHSTSGTLVRDLHGPLLAKTHFGPHSQSFVRRRKLSDHCPKSP